MKTNPLVVVVFSCLSVKRRTEKVVVFIFVFPYVNLLFFFFSLPSVDTDTVHIKPNLGEIL